MNRLKISLFLFSYSFISHVLAAAEIKGVDPEKWVAINECPEPLVEKFRYHISNLDDVGEWVKKIDGPYLCFKNLKMDQFRIGVITENRVSEECTSTWFVHSDFDREKNKFELGAWSFGATEQKSDCPMKRDYRMKGASKNSNFFVRARKSRPQSRSLRGVNEDLRTELTRQSRKKCIFRGALK